MSMKPSKDKIQIITVESVPTATSPEISALQGQWFRFHLTEELYSLFCDGFSSHEEKWMLLQKSAAQYHLPENPRSSVIFEYFYQSILFCCNNSFGLNQSQLYMSFVMETFEKSMTLNDHEEFPSCQEIQGIFYDLMMAAILAEQQDRRISVQTVEKMTTFFSFNFTRNLRAFQYVCQELQAEMIEFIIPEVQTPLIPACMSSCVSFKDHRISSNAVHTA